MAVHVQGSGEGPPGGKAGAVTRSRPVPRRVGFVLLFSLLAFGGGVAHALEQRAYQPVPFPVSACRSVAGAKIVEVLVIHADSQPVFYGLTEEVTIPASSKLAQALANSSDPIPLKQAQQCLFSVPSTSIPTLVSSVKGMTTFAISENTKDGPPLSFADGWTATPHSQSVWLHFQPQAVCPGHKGLQAFGPSWAGTSLTLSVISYSAPSRLTPLPSALRGRVYSWHYPKVACSALPHISVTVPVSLSSYASTIAYTSTIDGLPVNELIGWSSPIIIMLLGLWLVIRIRDFGGQSFAVKLILLAALGLAAAAIDLDHSGHALWGAAELAAVYGVAVVLVLRLRPIRRRLAVAAATGVVAATAALVIVVRSSTSSGDAIALEALALVLLVAVGVIGCSDARSVQFTAGDNATSKISLPSLRDSVVFWIGLALAVTLAYSVGNIVSWSSPMNIAFSEFATLRYPVAAFATVLVAVALVIPLAYQGQSARDPVVVAAAFGWAVLAQLPELTVAGIAFPGGEVFLAYLLYRVAITKKEPIPKGSPPASRLRTRLPRDNPAENTMLAIKIAAVLAIIPVSYFTYTTITNLPKNLQQPGPGVIFVVAGVVGQMTGWILTGIVFAGVSTRVRGGFGPIRALVISAAWFAAAFTVYVIDRWTQNPTGRSWSFFGLQLLLFLVTFGVIWDAYILSEHPGKDSLNQLREAYKLQEARAVVLYAVPLLLAIIVLGQQVANGSGVEFVKSALNVVPAVLGG